MMLEIVFCALLRMSISALWLIPTILLLRAMLRRAPRWALLLLWAVAAFRLICPASIETRFSPVPPPEAVTQAMQAPSEPVSEPELPTASEPTGTITLLSRIWLTGSITMLFWALWGDVRLRRRVRISVPAEGNIRLCDAIETPFVLGLIQPQIYLPSAIAPAQADYVLAHEQAHIARGDHWWKPLGWVVLSFYWFHPLVWLCYVLFSRDLELACDERVAGMLDRDGRRAYSEALLSCSTRSGALIAPVAFGETGVKSRVRAILRYRRPSRTAVALSVCIIFAVGVLFLTQQPVRALPLPDRMPGRESREDDWTIRLDDWVQGPDILPSAPDGQTDTQSGGAERAAVSSQAAASAAAEQSGAETATDIIAPPEIDGNMPPMYGTYLGGSSASATARGGSSSALMDGTVTAPAGPTAPDPNPQVGVIQNGDATAIRINP